MKHKLANDLKCPIPGCNVKFKQGISKIARVFICAPENSPIYGKSPLVCRSHVLQSIQHVDESVYDEEAVSAEAVVAMGQLAEFERDQASSSKAVVDLFPDREGNTVDDILSLEALLDVAGDESGDEGLDIDATSALDQDDESAEIEGGRG